MRGMSALARNDSQPQGVRGPARARQALLLARLPRLNYEFQDQLFPPLRDCRENEWEY